MNRTAFFVAAVLLVSTLGACDMYEQDEYQEETVVEAYLIAGDPLPPVKVFHTSPFRAFYSFDNVAIEGAEVTVIQLDASGEVTARYRYEQRSKGVYSPVDDTATVRPLQRYRLDVEVPGMAETVRATTLVPGAHHFVETTGDTIVYQGEETFEARLTQSRYPGRQSIYVFTLESLAPLSYDLTPYYQARVDDEDLDIERDDLIKLSSGVSNAANYEVNPDGTLTVHLLWLSVAFYGPNRIIASAIDDNLHDFHRSLGSGETESPGEIQNAIDHVENGRGIFGSMAQDSTFVFIKPNPALLRAAEPHRYIINGATRSDR